ncbi:glycosyltransferase family 2 protein [Catenovulum agarivorans]|uniref:glycosyltransferase family 2 protein n=1 Tax=Catenovulum agarivorans TaxID=1172192 RepID=UPI000303C658|nr:glycosyltransferase family 2 protein [Catenovulum agarivorans]
MLTVVILTYNESIHIERCIRSVQAPNVRVVIVDSFSTDDTCNLACTLGADVYKNKWVNHAVQFNWALDNCNIDTPWIMRLDADETVSHELMEELQSRLNSFDTAVTGLQVKRKVKFMGQWIKYGDYYPIWLLRVFRRGYGKSELRWMDEHIKVSSGDVVNLDNDITDENLNSLTWWTEKHNNYATREAVDLLNNIYNFFDYDDIKPKFFGRQLERKRWLKKKYAQLPLFFRPVIYFNYRYFIKVGFLDGRKGFIWHFLQGFWYRFLVDAKIYDIYRMAGKDKNEIKNVLKEIYKIDVGGSNG